MRLRNSTIIGLLLLTTGPAYAAKSGGEISLGAGVSSINYTQTNVPAYALSAISGKFGYKRPFAKGRWLLVGSGFGTLSALNTNGSPYTARFLGLNAKVGREFGKGPWTLGLAAGAYYATMMVTDNQFGYKNLSGPQFVPSITRKLKNGGNFTIYGKFALVQNKFQFLSSSNREVAAGASFSPWKKIFLAFDWSKLQLNFDDTGEAVASSTMTGSLGLTF